MSENTNYEDSSSRLMVLTEDLEHVRGAHHRFMPMPVFLIGEAPAGAYIYDQRGHPMRKREMKALLKLLEKGLASYSEEEEARNIQEEVDDFNGKKRVNCTPLQSTKKLYPGYVYVLKGENGRYKIGASKNPKQRVQQLRTSSSENHELVFAYRVNDHYKHEEITHSGMSHKRKHSEWFELNDEDLEMIKTYLSSVCIDEEDKHE